MFRAGHLEQALRIFGYLKIHPKRKLVFVLAHPAINKNHLQKCDWTEFYRDASEAIPGNMPKPRGNCMSTHYLSMQIMQATLRRGGLRPVSYCFVIGRQRSGSARGRLQPSDQSSLQ
jgi:hypothetical protein